MAPVKRTTKHTSNLYRTTSPYTRDTASKPLYQDIDEPDEPLEADSDPESSGPVSLLDMPGEIRNQIYEMAAGDASAKVTNEEGVTYTSESALGGVNRQIQSEFRGFMSLRATPLVFKVEDFDFAHVIKFLDETSEYALNTLPRVGRKGHRKIRVELTVTQSCPEYPDGLRAWLSRLDDTSKNGHDIKFEYHVERLRRVQGDGWRFARFMSSLVSVAAGLAVQAVDLESGRAHDEAEILKDLLIKRHVKSKLPPKGPLGIPRAPRP